MSEERFDASTGRVEKLTSKNYYLWANDIETFLRGKEPWEYVDRSFREPNKDDEKALEPHERKRDTAVAYLLMPIDTDCKWSVLPM